MATRSASVVGPPILACTCPPRPPAVVLVTDRAADRARPCENGRRACAWWPAAVSAPSVNDMGMFAVASRRPGSESEHRAPMGRRLSGCAGLGLVICSGVCQWLRTRWDMKLGGSWSSSCLELTIPRGQAHACGAGRNMKSGMSMTSDNVRPGRCSGLWHGSMRPQGRVRRALRLSPYSNIPAFVATVTRQTSSHFPVPSTSSWNAAPSANGTTLAHLCSNPPVVCSRW